MRQSRSLEISNKFTAEQIQQILDVSARTARRYKSGESTLNKAYCRLLHITLERRVMPDAWPREWQFDEADKLEMHGNTLSWSELEHYNFVNEQWRHCINLIKKQRDELDKMAPLLTLENRLRIIMLNRGVLPLVAKTVPDKHKLKAKMMERMDGC